MLWPTCCGAIFTASRPKARHANNHREHGRRGERRRRVRAGVHQGAAPGLARGAAPAGPTARRASPRRDARAPCELSRPSAQRGAGWLSRPAARGGRAERRRRGAGVAATAPGEGPDGRRGQGRRLEVGLRAASRAHAAAARGAATEGGGGEGAAGRGCEGRGGARRDRERRVPPQDPRLPPGPRAAQAAGAVGR